MALLLRQLSKYEPLKLERKKKNAKPVFQNGAMAVNLLEFIDNRIADTSKRV